MPDMTEAQAVVEYTADEAAATMKARPMTSRYLASFDQERLDEAMGIIGRYTDESGVRPAQIVWSPAELAAEDARTEPFTATHLQTHYGNALLNYARSEMTKLGMVNLDLAGEAWRTDANDPDAEEIATQPMVMFAALPTDSPQYIPGEQEAFCLWFVPTNTWLKRTVDKFTGAISYSLQGSYYDPRLDASADIENPPTPVGLGVHGIIRYFRSHASAVAAHGQLREAMRTYHAQIRLLEAGPRSLGGDNRAVVDAERRSSQPAPRRI
jgi:hypothetical protein